MQIAKPDPTRPVPLPSLRVRPFNGDPNESRYAPKQNFLDSQKVAMRNTARFRFSAYKIEGRLLQIDSRTKLLGLSEGINSKYGSIPFLSL